jgi:hypothetical protein
MKAFRCNSLTTSAEQFGTNIRAIAIPLTAEFAGLKQSMLMHETLWVLVAGSSPCAFLELFYLKETFYRDLDVYEEYGASAGISREEWTL